MSRVVTVRIKGYQFHISAPYSEGQRLGEAEALHLNDLRADNVRNNLKKLVDDACAMLRQGELLDTSTLAELQAQITRYDANYSLQLKHQAKPRIGMIELEALAIAEAKLEEELRKPGAAELAPRDKEIIIRQYAGLPEVLELARARISARREALSLTSLL